MRRDNEKKGTERVETRTMKAVGEGHVVFDFSGMEQPTIGDLALTLTARLGAAPHEKVWIRSIPVRTARALRVLRLDHLFLTLPEAEGQMN